MVKKLTLLAMAIGALVALAAPSMAGAAQLTNGGEELLPTGTTISATSTNTVTKTTLGEIKCQHVEIHGIVAENGGSVSVSMDGANDTATNCEIVGLGKVAIDPTFEGLAASGSGPGTAAFTFNVTGLCTSTSGASEVTWNGTDVIHIKAAVGGSCGTGTLNGDFTVTDDEGNPVIVED